MGRTKEDRRGVNLIREKYLPPKEKQMPSISPQASSSSPTSSSTPTWDPSDSSRTDISPAWDPSSRTPPCSQHWLHDSALQRHRLKLKVNDPSVQSPYVEFLGLEDDLVKVRDKIDIQFVTLESISPLHPTSKGDLVIPKAGQMQGVPFNVIHISGDSCVVRKPGTRPTKKNPDPEFAISDLLQIHPTPPTGRRV